MNKKVILVVSLIAMFAVGSARADIASTDYVDSYVSDKTVTELSVNAAGEVNNYDKTKLLSGSAVETIVDAAASAKADKIGDVGNKAGNIATVDENGQYHVSGIGGDDVQVISYMEVEGKDLENMSEDYKKERYPSIAFAETLAEKKAFEMVNEYDIYVESNYVKKYQGTVKVNKAMVTNDNGHVVPGAIITGMITDKAVTNGKIADKTIEAGKLNYGTIPANCKGEYAPGKPKCMMIVKANADGTVAYDWQEIKYTYTPSN